MTELITNKDLDKVQEEMDDQKDYDEIYNKSGIQLFCKKMPNLDGIAAKRWKWFGNMPYNTETVYLTLSTFDMEERKQWDKSILDYKTVEIIKGELQNVVFYEASAWPWPMTSRDWICIGADRVEKHENGKKFVSYAKKCDHKDYPKDSPYVKVDTYHWSVCLTPKFEDGKEFTEYCIISQFDPNGWIPEFLVSYAINMLPKDFETDIIKGCENTKQKKIKFEEAKLNGLNWTF